MADAERSATTEEANDEGDDLEDATSLMGFKGRRGTSSERRRRRTRSRTPQRGTDRPWRRPWRRTSEETTREGRNRSHDHEHEWRCAEEAHEAPSHTTRRVGAPSTSTLAAETLSLNRLTWRSILCMEVSAPGGSSDQTLSEPLDQDQMNNVRSTAMQMSPGERLAFLASLMQFLMEVGHQIASNIVVGGVPIAEAHYEEDDDVMTMQVGMRSSLTKSGMEFDHIQVSLEKSGHKRQRAGLLYRQLQAQPHLANHPELSTLMAMLLVYRDDSYGDMDETTSDADAAWAQTFVSSVLQMVTISGATSSMAPAILVDTPVENGPTDIPQVDDRGRSRSPTRPEPCQEQLQREAQRYREWEDWTMHQEMHHPRCVSTGLVLDVGAKADGVMHQVSLPLPTESLLNVEICLRFRRPQLEPRLHERGEEVDEDLDGKPENDALNLMQRQLRRRSPMSHLLQALGPQARVEVSYGLLAPLRRQLSMMLQRMLYVMDFLDETQATCGNSEGTMVSGELDRTMIETAIQAILHALDNDLNHLGDDGTEDLAGLVTRLQRLARPPDGDLEIRRRRTASSSAVKKNATPKMAIEVANRIRDDIRGAVFQCAGGHLDMVRQISVVIVERMQCLATQLHTLVLLLSDMLPQPMAESSDTSHSRRLGQAFARDVLDSLEQNFQCNAEETLNNEAFDVTQLLPILQGLNPMVNELMAFLEDADMPDDESSEADIRPNGTISDRLSTYLGGTGLPTNETQEVPDQIKAPDANDTQMEPEPGLDPVVAEDKPKNIRTLLVEASARTLAGTTSTSEGQPDGRPHQPAVLPDPHGPSRHRVQDVEGSMRPRRGSIVGSASSARPGDVSLSLALPTETTSVTPPTVRASGIGSGSVGATPGTTGRVTPEGSGTMTSTTTRATPDESTWASGKGSRTRGPTKRKKGP